MLDMLTVTDDEVEDLARGAVREAHRGMRQVIGVIGHVDHGKTALVRALTGMETDRLAEEKRRGISIALGFAHLALPGAELDFIDMPGHERFVRTMVSGATGIDAVLVAVSANEGIKPQTVEHLDIAGLLGVQRAIIVVTKADLAAPGDIASVSREAAALTRQAGIAVCAEIAVSAIRGDGMDALRQALAALSGGPAAASDGFPYLPIDRVFSMAGHGTVVTGTLRRGPLAASDEIEFAPAGRPVRLRGLQVHGAKVTAAQPGQRVAANLRDVEPGQVRRGAALTARGLMQPSAWLSVSLRLVDNALAIATGARLMLLFGTEEVEARLRLLDRDEAAPGEAVLAQLQCISAVAVPARERFILRRISPPLTVAGGRILDPAAIRLRRRAPAILARLAALAEAEPALIVRQGVEAAGEAGATLDALARLAGVAPARAAEWLQDAPVVIGRGHVVTRAALGRAGDAVMAVLAASAADGLSREQLAAKVPRAGAAVLDEAVAEGVRRGALVQAGGLVRIRRDDRDREKAAQESTGAGELAELLRRGGLSPPDPGKTAPGPQTKRLLDRLVREGVAVRARDLVQKRDVLFHRDAIEEAQRRLTPLLEKSSGLLVSEVGAALGISRKYSVPLLEHLDAIQFTRRVADRRMLAPRR